MNQHQSGALAKKYPIRKFHESNVRFKYVKSIDVVLKSVMKVNMQLRSLENF